MKTSSRKSATNILRKDHQALKSLLARLDKATMPRDKEDIVLSLSMELGIHDAVEEQVFYPAVQEILKDPSLVDHSREDHSQVKLIIDKMMRMLADFDGKEYDEHIAMLKEAIESHIKSDEESLLPQVEKSDLDLAALGEQMVETREALTAAPPQRD